EELQVFFNRQGGVEVAAQPLRHEGYMRADTVAVTAARHVATQHLHAAVLADARAGGQRQQARFTDTVRPYQPHHAAGRQRQVALCQGGGATVGEADMVEANHGIGAGRLVCSAHSGIRTASSSGHVASASSLSQATPGTPVFTASRCSRSSAGSMRALTRNISFCRSLAVSTVFGVNCAVLATNETLAGITNC